MIAVPDIDRLRVGDDGRAHLAAGAGLSAPELGFYTQAALQAGVSALAGVRVEPVSITLDVTGRVAEGEAAAFETRIDRQTRTMVFANAQLRSAGANVMMATGVFRILL